ncbi:cell envelope integrity protein TolA [Peredibacter sp. HCB2-198]|uniref:cell envelope integrity protein TolA n=1 Tax=Peredibacter sp. HCB2-198 TaxID=3383025 RepID=UPI0038B5777F
MFSKTDDFNKNFLISLGAHTVLFLLCFAGGELISKVWKNGDVEIIRSSVRVDVVGMPKFTIQELKKMQAEPIIEKQPEVAKGVKEETKVETEDVIKKDDLVIQEQDKKKKANFLNMLSDYSSKKVTAKAQKKGAVAATGDKNLDSLVIEGNRLSKGSALVGDYTDEQNSEFSAYVQNLPGVIRPFWKLPSYLMDKDLRCRIKIYLSSTGHLLKLEIQESSGTSEFDSRAEKAVRDASPFPKPSEEVGARLTNSGIILGFPL